MTLDLTLAILNELLAAEQAAITPHLFEAEPFISRLSVNGVDTARRMARASREQSEALTALMFDLGGVPGPRRIDVAVADLHYQDLHFVLPRLVADHERLVQKYRLALRKLGGAPKAALLVSRILGEHELELVELRKLAQRGQKKAS